MSALATPDHPVWREIAPQLAPRDFRHPGMMDVDFLRLLSRVRRDAAVPFRIVSDYRTPEGNPGASASAHLDLPCRAVDLRVLTNHERWAVVRAAIAAGITRLGIYAPTASQIAQYGKASGSVHLDASTTNPQDRIWMSW